MASWGADWSGQCELPGGLNNVIGLGAGEEHSVALVAGTEPQHAPLQPKWQGGRFSVLVQSLNRRSCALEYTTSFAWSNWTVLSTHAGHGALKMLSDTNAMSPQRFYRVGEW